MAWESSLNSVVCACISVRSSLLAPMSYNCAPAVPKYLLQYSALYNSFRQGTSPWCTTALGCANYMVMGPEDPSLVSQPFSKHVLYLPQAERYHLIDQTCHHLVRTLSGENIITFKDSCEFQQVLWELLWLIYLAVTCYLLQTNF